jgi:hypothetical protein
MILRSGTSSSDYLKKRTLGSLSGLINHFQILSLRG